MASESVPSFDELETVNPSTDYEDEDVERIKLEPGESIVGEVREIRRNLGEFDSTLIFLARGLGDVVKMWSNGQIDRRLDAANVAEGDVIGIAKGEEEQSYTDDEGEVQDFYEFEVRVLGGSQ